MAMRGKVVWITGGSSGIGEALARRLLGAGARVIVTARRTARLEALRDTASDPGSVAVVPGDLLDLAGIPALASRAEAAFGRIDVLVNNAGRVQRGWARETALPVVRELMDLNFLAPVALTQAVLPPMLARRDGHIVNISSVVGYVATPKRSAYAASKHALQGYSNALRAELHGTGVSVSVVCPGYVRTEASVSAATASGLAQGHMDASHEKGMSPDVFAGRLLRVLERRPREAWIGGPEVWSIWLARLFPGLLARVVHRAIPG
jgi:short-subunit dehydrogenase